MNYSIPTTIVDNFFNDPIEVREFALKQEFTSDPTNNYPGKRTESVAKLNLALYQHVLDRFHSVFYSSLSEIEECNASMTFQLIDKTFKSGWVHRDSTIFSGLIYLNPLPNPEGGTTIYKPLYTGTTEMSLEGNQSRSEEDKLKNNSNFAESIVIKNQFNRLIAFDSRQFHAAINFFGDTDQTSRLTLVFFIERLITDKLPMQRAYFI
jgi:hypothetical protein